MLVIVICNLRFDIWGFSCEARVWISPYDATTSKVQLQGISPELYLLVSMLKSYISIYDLGLMIYELINRKS